MSKKSQYDRQYMSTFYPMNTFLITHKKLYGNALFIVVLLKRMEAV